MKIRNGFVSNSSSSSFTLDYKTTGEAILALARAHMEDEASYDWNKAEAEEYKAVIQNKMAKFVKLLETNPGFDEPIIYPWTCNYESFIWKGKSGLICVDTCNNHRWEDTKLGEHIVDYYNEDGFEYNDTFEREKYTFLDLEDMITKTYQKWQAAWKEKWLP